MRLRRKLPRTFVRAPALDSASAGAISQGQLVAVLPAEQFTVSSDGERWLIHDLHAAAEPSSDPYNVAPAQEHLASGETLANSPHVIGDRVSAAARLRAINERNRWHYSPEGQRDAAMPPSMRRRAQRDHEVPRGRLVGSIPSERFVVEHGEEAHRVYDFHPEADPRHDPEDVDAALRYLAAESGFISQDHAILRDARRSPQEMLGALLRITDEDFAARRAAANQPPTLADINRANKRAWFGPDSKGQVDAHPRLKKLT